MSRLALGAKWSGWITPGHRSRCRDADSSPPLKRCGSSSEANARPENFHNADPDEATRKVVALVRRYCPHILITYDENGAYGHPDHKVVSRLTVQACTQTGDASAYELEALALGLAPWSPSKLYFLTTNRRVSEALHLPPQPLITTRISIKGFEEAKSRAFAHHETQSQEWEPLRTFMELQGDVELYSLVGATHDLGEDDLFHGVS